MCRRCTSGFGPSCRRPAGYPGPVKPDLRGRRTRPGSSSTRVSDGVLPYPRAVTPAYIDRLQHESDLLAERCLLFVACTRARDGLHVSWSGAPSEFLVEAGVRQAL